MENNKRNYNIKDKVIAFSGVLLTFIFMISTVKWKDMMPFDAGRAIITGLIVGVPTITTMVVGTLMYKNLYKFKNKILRTILPFVSVLVSFWLSLTTVLFAIGIYAITLE
ncbi:MAG: hypothetical protein ACRC41_13780 [Sarcina sp.]